jgi:hypothetical protein
MSDLVTVFEISSTSNGVLSDTAVRFFIGAACLIGGVRALASRWRHKDERRKGWVGPIFLIAWSVGWIYLHNFPHVLEHIHRLVGAYRHGQYEIVEGEVQVLHQQPATGHTSGDRIAVIGKQFEVNYFYATPAYRKTIAHGGVLAAGVYARIYYYEGEILRLDVRR